MYKVRISLRIYDSLGQSFNSQIQNTGAKIIYMFKHHKHNYSNSKIVGTQENS
jgi:hypothetical protein